MPGHRKAVPPRLERSSEQPARARAPRVGTPRSGTSNRPAAGRPPPARPLAARPGRDARGLSWPCATSSVDLLVEQSLAAALGVLLATGLAVRSGGRGLPVFALAALVGGAAVATQSPTLLAGAAVATGVLAACLAVLATTPARSFGPCGPRGGDRPGRRHRRSPRRRRLRGGPRPRPAPLHRARARRWPRPSRWCTGSAAVCTGSAVPVSCSFGAAFVLLVVGLAYTAALTHWGSPDGPARPRVGQDVDATTGSAAYLVRSRCCSACPPSPGE